MLRVGYLFERFPSFGQTFCYREVAELERQGADVTVFSIRTPSGEPTQDWDENLVRRVRYLPEEAELVKEIDRAARKGDLPAAAVAALKEWGRETDFLRLYQAAHVGLQLRKAGIDWGHAHFAGMAARTAYWIGRFFGVRYSITAHANDIFAPRPFTIGLTDIFENAAAVVTVSDFAAARLRQQYPGAAAKTYRVYNGIDVARFARADFSRPVPLILSVGRLIEKKGFADLIRACALLRDRGRRFHCEIIGEGPLEAALLREISDAGVSEHVRLLGPRAQHEIAERLRLAHLFVLACTTESDGGMDNLPTVIMEAMAAGLPVISTHVAGVPEMVQAGVTGELVADRDPVALAEAIDRMIADRTRASAYGNRGRELAQEKFSIQTNVRALAEILGST